MSNNYIDQPPPSYDSIAVRSSQDRLLDESENARNNEHINDARMDPFSRRTLHSNECYMCGIVPDCPMGSLIADGCECESLCTCVHFCLTECNPVALMLDALSVMAECFAECLAAGCSAFA
ncbi:hypothetical protein ACO0QE_000523 [Hanseniaspora vineae]